MTENEFRAKFKEEAPIYETWGHIVNNYITEKLEGQFGENFKGFFKICPAPRVKDVENLVAKAFYRNKGYTDPYEEIKDKVGVRYVVLTTPEIKTIADVIVNNATWDKSKDRDFEQERKERPLVFDYQSDHYIVTNKDDIKTESMTIPKATPCEIQIRTLLQHAYAELTHDTIYKKPHLSAIPDVHRLTAKSMALMEITDDIFVQVKNKIAEESNNMDMLFSKLTELYKSLSSNKYERSINIFILDAYRDLIPSIDFGKIEQFITENTFIKEKILERSTSLSLYRQPIILLMYYLIKVQRTTARQLWPLTETELEPLYTDLGIAFNPGH